jgi:hypothetical protein
MVIGFEENSKSMPYILVMEIGQEIGGNAYEIRKTPRKKIGSIS